MHRLSNPVQRYAWGSPTLVPEFLGLPADGRPVAEVWMGAHASAPSRLDGEDGPQLDAELVRRPEELLGADVADRFGTRLPFLLKLLAAGGPLSLQVHPTTAQAEDGHAREDAAGLPTGAAHRNYKDAHHKPELVLALTRFRAMCGFREPADSLAVLDRLAPRRTGVLAGVADALALADPAAALRSAFDLAVGAAPSEVAVATRTLAVAASALVAAGADDEDAVTLVELERAHPGDVGVLLSLLLHHVVLAPGESLFLGAGQVHAYLEGLAVEAMASSDNVLRAGLTPKHVDTAELRSVVDFRPVPVPRLEPTSGGPGVLVLQPPVEDFGLDLVDVPVGAVPDGPGPRILLALDGGVAVESAGERLALARGEAVFVPAGEPVVLTGSGRVAVARVARP